MNAVIFNPLEEFEAKYQEKHRENTEKFLEDLVRRSGIDTQQNRLTVKQYDAYRADLAKLRKKRNWWRFLRVLMCITILLIPLVILKITPKIRDLRAHREIADAKQRGDWDNTQSSLFRLGGGCPLDIGPAGWYNDFKAISAGSENGEEDHYRIFCSGIGTVLRAHPTGDGLRGGRT